jgi:hypothetical protein
MVNPDMNMNMQRATGAGNVTVESHSEEDLGVDDTVQVFGDADNSTLLQTVPSPPASPAPEHESTADASLGETRAQSVNVADASAYAARAASVQAQRQEESLLKRRAQAASLNRMAMLGECANSEEMRDFVQMRDLEQAREQAQERAKRGREMSKPLADERQSLQHRLLWKPKQTSTSVAAVTIELQLRKVRKELRWRGPRERACRVGAAWAFNLTVLVLAYLVSIIFCARFGERETSTMSVSWLIAYGLVSERGRNASLPARFAGVAHVCPSLCAVGRRFFSSSRCRSCCSLARPSSSTKQLWSVAVAYACGSCTTSCAPRKFSTEHRESGKVRETTWAL